MPETRLIDANALLKKLQEQQKYSSVTDSRGRAKAILELIAAPTVDEVPVKRGRWIDIGHNAGLKCSNCGKRIRYRNGIKTEITVTDGRFNHTHEASKNGYYNFCPKCGFDMREVKDADS